MLVVFFAGLCGLLSAWGGLITANTDENLYMIQVGTGHGRGSMCASVVVVVECVCGGGDTSCFLSSLYMIQVGAGGGGTTNHPPGKAGTLQISLNKSPLFLDSSIFWA